MPTDVNVTAAPAENSTKALVSWALYDWGNSAFAAIIQTFVFAAYFTQALAPDETIGTAIWGNAVGLAGLVIAISAPLLGAFADQRGRRKPALGVLTLLCVACTAGLWFMLPDADYMWPAAILLCIAVISFELAAVLYNAMLPELAPAAHIGRWSGWGWGVGYLGGLICLVLALLLFIDENNAWWPLDRNSAAHVRATFLLTALWFGLFALPLFLFSPDRPATPVSRQASLRLGLQQLVESARHISRYRHLVRFFIGRMIYIDGLTTIFAFGGIYAAGTFNMSEQQVLVFGIGLNLTGGIGAATFALLDDRIGGKKTVLWALFGLILSAGLILLVRDTLWFWIIGLCMGLFVGPAQAASRSYLARMAPAELRNEMFGLLAFSGKATAFLGPFLVGWLTLASGSQRIGMSVILVFLLVGFALMCSVPDDKQSLQTS